MEQLVLGLSKRQGQLSPFLLFVCWASALHSVPMRPYLDVKARALRLIAQ
jgi:hypothetical protein